MCCPDKGHLMSVTSGNNAVQLMCKSTQIKYATACPTNNEHVIFCMVTTAQ